MTAGAAQRDAQEGEGALGAAQVGVAGVTRHDCGLSFDVTTKSVLLGGVLADPLAGDAVARIVKKLIARAGLDRTDFSAHSLRSGFLSSAAEHNASVFKMQEQSRHRSLDVLSGYVRSKNRFAQHAGSGFL